MDAELEQFPMDARCAPQGVGRGHSGNKGADVSVDLRAAHGAAAGEPGPVVPEALPLPPQDGVGPHQHQRLPPVGPHPGQADPEEPIGSAQLRSVRGSLIDGELLA